MNIIRIATLLFCLLISHSLFAYVSGKVRIAEKLVYCPEQVTCTQDGNIKSCSSSGEQFPYWKNVGDNGDSSGVINGTYKLVNVAGRYHWPASGSASTCIYENADTGVSKTIAVYAKFESNLEAFYDKSTKWIISDKGYPFPSYCRSSSPQLCPLTEQSALGILNSTDEAIFASGNQNRPINPKSMGVIRYEDALGICGSVKECQINIGNDQSGYTSITVDMDTKLKILKIIQPRPSSGLEIKQIIPFNTIEVYKSYPQPILSKIKVYNFINSTVSVAVNGSSVANSIEPKNYGDVFSDRVLTDCQNIKECTIDINLTGGGGRVGSVIVDMDNNMNILRTTSQRDSEIVINQISPNSIEVKYPSVN